MYRRIDPAGVFRASLLIVISSVMIFSTGCQKAEEELDYGRALPPGELALRKIVNPDDIPSMAVACYEMHRLREAIDNSLSYLSKPSSQQFFPYGQITHEWAVASLESFAELIESGLRGRELEQAILQGVASSHLDAPEELRADTNALVRERDIFELARKRVRLVVARDVHLEYAK